MRSLPLLLLLTLGVPLLPACGADDEPPPETEADAGDGKIRPAANGVHTSEAAACDALLQGYEARRSALGCAVGTTRTCPGLVRSQVGGTACLEYDQGSVAGCLDHYAEQATCDALGTAIDLCVVTAYPETEGSGCP